MNWQKAIDRINAEKFQVPAGWDTKEKIANELQCSPDRVHDLLKTGLTSGAFESQEFAVWDPKRRMTVRVRCYRQKPSGDVEQVDPVKGSLTLRDKVLRALAKNPNATDSKIARNLHRVTPAEVAAVRATL